jgi:hypothetical protein
MTIADDAGDLLLEGHGASANGDRLTLWFTELGQELLSQFKRAEQETGHSLLPEFTAKELEAALKTQIVMVTTSNRDLLRNQFGEIKDVRIVADQRTGKPLIFANEDVLQNLYDNRKPDLGIVLHAYLLAAHKDDENYKISRLHSFTVRNETLSKASDTGVSSEKNSNSSVWQDITPGGGCSNDVLNPCLFLDTEQNLVVTKKRTDTDWAHANLYCLKLNQGEIGGWRLPTQFELRFLVMDGVRDLLGSDDGFFWSSSKSIDSDKMLGYHVKMGTSWPRPKSSSSATLCVREN